MNDKSLRRRIPLLRLPPPPAALHDASESRAWMHRMWQQTERIIDRLKSIKGAESGQVIE